MLLDKVVQVVLYSSESKIEIARKALKEGDSELFFSTIDKMKDSKYDKVLAKLTRECARLGRKNELQYMIKRDVTAQNDLDCCAAEGGHLELVLDLIKDKNYSKIAIIAIENGHILLAETMIEKYGAELSKKQRLESAAEGNDLNTDQIDGGDLDQLAYRAACGGHNELVLKLINMGADSYDYIIEGAIENNHLQVFNTMVELGITEFDYTISIAAECGHLDIVKRMIEEGCDQYMSIAYSAVHGGKIDVLKFIIDELDNKELDTLLVPAAKNGFRIIVNYLLTEKTQRVLRDNAKKLESLCKLYPID